MTALPGPFSYLELLHSQSLNFVPASWEFGEYTFTVGSGRTKTVSGVRIHLSKTKGPQLYHGLPYIDIGQQKLLYSLRPLLAGAIPEVMEFMITAYGSRPRTEYSVSVRQV